MTIEEIYMRKEIRQLMSECGFNKETIGDLLKDAIEKEVHKVAMEEAQKLKNSGRIAKALEEAIKASGYGSIRNAVQNVVKDMRINVDINLEK